MVSVETTREENEMAYDVKDIKNQEAFDNAVDALMAAYYFLTLATGNAETPGPVELKFIEGNSGITFTYKVQLEEDE